MLFAKRIYIWILIVLAASCVSATAQVRLGDNGYLLRGIVRDSATNAVLPHALVSLPGTALAAVADGDGIFGLTVPDTASLIEVRAQGYETRRIGVRKNRVNMYEVRLPSQPVMLGEVVVHKHRYSKRNNPAVDLMQRIRQTKHSADPRMSESYGYDKYECITMALNNFGEKGLSQKFAFLAEHTDTSEVTGNVILPLSLRERRSHVHYGQGKGREAVQGYRAEGIDAVFEGDGVTQFIGDVMREVDIFDNNIALMQNRFVSPLSSLAADFYKFYVTGTAVVDGDTCTMLSFYPHNRAVLGFTGSMAVQTVDSTVIVRSIDMRVPREANLNFVEGLGIRQTYARGPGGTRLKLSDDMVVELRIAPGTPGLYARRNVAYSNHSFEDSAFVDAAAMPALEGDTAFWAHARPRPLSANEARIGLLMARLRRVPVFYWGEKIVRILQAGYLPTAKASKFDIGPLNTFVGGSTLEGLRVRAGGMTTARLSPHLFARGYMAYGFRDHRPKYGLTLDWSFKRKKIHSNEFPVHGFRFESKYDVDQLGQRYLFTSADNIFVSIKRMRNDMVVYERYNALTYKLETKSHFSVEATLANSCHYGSRLLRFSHADGTPFNRFEQSYGEISLRFAPGEKFYQTRSYRFPINQDAPVVSVSHRWGPAGKGISRYGVNRTEGYVQKRWFFSAWGYLDFMAMGGHVWSRQTAYTQLFVPNANLSYTVQPESFALLNPMEFVTDSYSCWYATYWLNGALLNYVPWVKKHKLREVVSCNGYWGTLSWRNMPSGDALALPVPVGNDRAMAIGNRDALRHTPYVEVSAGLDNIAKCLRVDYVWRVTHRNPGYDVDRGGLRVSFHMTF